MSACAVRAARPFCSNRWNADASAATRSSVAARAFATLAEAEACGEPVVGYVAYDYAARLEPTVPLPAEGTGLPESRFPRRGRVDQVRPRPRHRRGDPRRCERGVITASPAGPTSSGVEGAARQRATHTEPDGLRDMGSCGQGTHPGRRRVPDRALTAGRAGPLRLRRSSYTAHCVA